MRLAAVQASRGISHHTTTGIAWEIHFRASGTSVPRSFGMGTGPSSQLWPPTPLNPTGQKSLT